MTFFNQEACKEINAKQNDRNKKKKEVVQSQETPPPALDPDEVCASNEGVPAADHLEAGITPVQQGQLFQWKVLPCFVKCSMDGTPFEPMEYGGFAPDNIDAHPDVADGAPKKAPKKGHMKVDPKQTTFSKYVKTGIHPQMLADTDTIMIDEDMPAAQENAGAIMIQTGSEIGAASVSGASSSASGMFMNPVQMLSDIHTFITDKQDTTKWLKTIPNVAVKESYANLDAPKAKGEGVGRAFWPKVIHKDCVELPAFQEYLDNHMAKNDASVGKIMLGTGRALGALEVTCKDGHEEIQISDVRVIVGLYTSNQHQHLLELPILHPKYYWTASVIFGIISYAQFHLRELMQKSIQGDGGPLVEYKLALQSLIEDMKAGHSKRCAVHKESSMAQKARDDLRSIKNMPHVDRLKQGVLDGYMTLKLIVKKFEGQSHIPRLARGAANAAISGGIHFDTFGGRKWEWEHADYAYICSVLDSDQRYIICQQHKTSKTYGDLAKKLTPGLYEALCNYRRLPRPDMCTTFLVPAQEGTSVVSIPKSLKTFCSRYLADCAVHPTTNLTRKFFHCKLMSITEDAEKLKDMMVVLDAHSKKVMGKHYILRDPEDDVALADALIHAILGKTVTFPSDAAVDEHLVSNDEFARTISRIMSDCDQVDKVGHTSSEVESGEDCEEDEEPLLWWAHAHVFGVPKPAELLVPLLDSSELGNFEVLADIDEQHKEEAQASLTSGCVIMSQKLAVKKTSKKEVAHVQQSCDVAMPQKLAQIAPEKRKMYDGYKESTGPSVRRMRVDPQAHGWMGDQLKVWQEANGKAAHELPYSNEWYLDKRVEAIQAGLLQKAHSEDVVRSYLKSQTRKNFPTDPKPE